MSVGRTRRVAIAAHEPLLREGLALVLSGAAEIVARVGSIEELGAVAEPFDVLVTHVGNLREAIALAEICGPWTRIVAIHDTLSPADVGATLAAGVSAMVDTCSRPSLLIDAVIGEYAATRLRWSRPAIGPMPLTPRERDVLMLVADGLTCFEVAESLGIGARTVEKHKQRIFERLGVQSQAHAVAVAVRAGMLEPATGPTRARTGRRR